MWFSKYMNNRQTPFTLKVAAQQIKNFLSTAMFPPKNTSVFKIFKVNLIIFWRQLTPHPAIGTAGK